MNETSLTPTSNISNKEHQARNTKHEQGYRPTTEILSMKNITLGNLLSALSTNKILDFSYSLRSASRITSTNKTPLKLTGNTSSKEYQAQARPQTDNRNTEYIRDPLWQLTINFEHQ